LLAKVVGSDGLASLDRTYLAFGEAFEKKLVNQAGGRTLDDSMEVGWKLLGMLPAVELHRLNDAQLEKCRLAIEAV
jgi:V/A-type H+-transporting ATPase subunit B